MKHSRKLERRIFKLVYADRRFEHVEQACLHVLGESLTPDSPIYFPLVSSIHCNYAALFTEAEGNLGAVTHSILHGLSAEQRALHDLIIRLRNKVFAHVDPTIEGKMPTEEDGKEFAFRLNEVRVFVANDGSSQRVTFGLNETRALPTGVDRIRDLVVLLRKNIHKDLEESLFKRYKLKTKPGEYVINGRVFFDED